MKNEGEDMDGMATGLKNLLEKEYPQWYRTHFPPILTGLTKIPDTSYNLTKVLRDDQK